MSDAVHRLVIPQAVQPQIPDIERQRLHALLLAELTRRGIHDYDRVTQSIFTGVLSDVLVGGECPFCGHFPVLDAPDFRVYGGGVRISTVTCSECRIFYVSFA